MIFDKLAAPVIAINDLRGAISKVAGASKLWAHHHITDADAKVQHLHTPDVKPRKMADSFSRAIIPLSNPQYREKYINALKQIRFGRLLEDLDSLAVFISYKHNNLINPANINEPKRSGFSVVTALVDQIIKNGTIDSSHDLLMNGHVSWVGRSSMEITMNLEQRDNDGVRKILSALFVMVAIDAIKKTPIQVTPLAPAVDDQEKAIIARGVTNQKRRLEQSDQSLFRKPPDVQEAALVHDLYLTTLDPSRHSFKDRSKPSYDVWMKDTSMKGLIICHPEYRNIYGKIFGGFLMRQAYELAWAEAYKFSNSRPVCVAVDDIIFRRPVEVGSLLYLHQSIGYTDEDYMQARVTAEVTDPNDPSRRELANIFHFTFKSPLPAGRPPLPRIIPDSYGEAMLFLDSRRRMMQARQRLQEECVSLDQKD